MNSLPHATPARLSAPQRAGIRPLWLASAAWVIASIACAAVAMANVPVGEWSPGLSASAALPRVESPVKTQRAAHSPVTEAANPRSRVSCQTCGVVEIIRKFEAVGALPGGYEFTVRLRDGSTRVSRDANPANWRVGDSIMLIGGAKPLSETQVSL